MKVSYGSGETEFGPGVCIALTGDEVATAIDAWLVARGVQVGGSRTITVNGKSCEAGEVFVEPSGYVVADGLRLSGRGPERRRPMKQNEKGEAS
ncbi:hypothetical protein G6L37_07325 [Agrobacterium rubi]|nr:hypothetical protein [Agrobacterium rubi]NTF25178.1 hypothetical protein [Agrobacterium rubi]